MKANERDSRTEQERFIDRMLKEILGGQRNPGDRLPTESELAAQYDLRKTNVHLALKELERLGFLEIVPRHATYVAPYWERANLETLAVIMTHGVTPHPELVDAFMELREMVALGWFCWVGRRPNAAQMQKLYGLLAQMDAIAYVPDGDKAAFLELLNAFLVCMFRESDNMIFRVMLRSTRELAHVAYYMVAYTLDMQELCRVYRAVLDGLTDGCVPEAIACCAHGATGSRCATARRSSSCRAHDRPLPRRAQRLRGSLTNRLPRRDKMSRRGNRFFALRLRAACRRAKIR